MKLTTELVIHIVKTMTTEDSGNAIKHRALQLNAEPCRGASQLHITLLTL